MITQRQLFLQHCAQTSDFPLMLEFERAEGMYLYNPEGKAYLDLIAGISVSNLGHRHPAVIGAVEEQLKKYTYLMVYGEYVQAPQVQFARCIATQTPGSLNSIFFVNSGSEATEGAMKLAKRYTGRTEIISFRKGYHGSTQGALSIMGDERFKRTFRPLLPDVRQLAFNNEDDLGVITENTAAVIAEPIQSEAGVIVPDKNFLKKLREKCSATGALLIFDEAQTALGRTGKMFAYEHFEVIPDILILAKALGGGFPLGAFVASKEIMSVLQYNPVLGHITTFGGHPVSCAAGLAALKTLLGNHSLIKDVSLKEILFLKLLKHEKIKAVRSAGLLIAVEFENFEINKKIIDRCIANGVLTDWFLFADNCLRIAPPLIITEAEIRNACEIIIKSIDSI